MILRSRSPDVRSHCAGGRSFGKALPHYVKEALRYVEGMTDRERYSTRGLYYTMTGDYQKCAKEYSDQIARYPAEVLAHNNLSLCLSYLRNMPKALDEVRWVAVYLAPWMLRRLRGRSSGDGITPKRPTLCPVDR